jgi:hypothetical protein
VSAREVAVILHDDKAGLYGVQVRRRIWGWLWWERWRTCVTGTDETGFKRERAQYLADQALLHGWVDSHIYYDRAHPIIGKDEE